MPPKRSGDSEPDALYRVFRSSDKKLAYLPGEKGLPLEEAQRLSNNLAIETYIEKVWERED